jgi:uncharacterized peroxidase-related enzyme
MTEFRPHTIDTAPEGSKSQLEASKKAFGMVPNLHAVLAESPQALEAYKTLTRLFSESSLSTEQRHVVWLTINVENQCHYCLPAHTALALMDKVPQDVIDAIRNQQPINDPKLEALRSFTRTLIAERGQVSEGVVQTFLDAGYSKANLIDVVLGASHKTLSNYLNHVADTPVDAPFQKFV